MARVDIRHPSTGEVLFAHEELQSPDTGEVRLHPGFADDLAYLRMVFGKPMIVTSCCRSAAHNEKIGGHPRSLHVHDRPNHGLEGTAAIDIKATDGRYKRALLRHALDLGWAVGVSRSFLHLDRRGLVGMALGGPAGGAVGGLLASALGVEAEPDRVKAAVQQDPEAALKLRELEARHREKIEALHLEAETARQAQINKTMRAEVGSEDAYVRRWRPTFGYVVALAWAAQMGGVTWAVVATPQWSAEIINAMTSLSVIWSVALSVLGINVAKRSRDKEVLAGRQPESGALGKVLQGVFARTGDNSAAARNAPPPPEMKPAGR